MGKQRPASVKFQSPLTKQDHNLVFNKYCKGHYFLYILHLVKMGMIAVTEGLQFSLLGVDFYCSISCKWETEGKHLLACKIELIEGHSLQL